MGPHFSRNKTSESYDRLIPWPFLYQLIDGVKKEAHRYGETDNLIRHLAS
jgi:hypothetical protein